MIVVDTSAWVDYFNGRPTATADLLDYLLLREPLVIGDLILAEVLRGFRSDLDFRRALVFFRALEFQAMVGRKVAIDSARNYRRLRARGVSVRKTIDVMIGTFCIKNGHQLLHADRDFDPMERYLGLRVVRV
ncbi:MAG: PIN domain nuclease [Candidatus Binatus sp.]|jgi:predicted nucleic acid-binding protein|uniref:type II toxin-antitoxin system VapC family toxin n=1 Tax=Candidatus Binatus sp. TaxID=2811406 RepID=UPI003C7F7395